MMSNLENRQMQHYGGVSSSFYSKVVICAILLLCVVGCIVWFNLPPAALLKIRNESGSIIPLMEIYDTCDSELRLIKAFESIPCREMVICSFPIRSEGGMIIKVTFNDGTAILREGGYMDHLVGFVGSYEIRGLDVITTEAKLSDYTKWYGSLVDG